MKLNIKFLVSIARMFMNCSKFADYNIEQLLAFEEQQNDATLLFQFDIIQFQGDSTKTFESWI